MLLNNSCLYHKTKLSVSIIKLKQTKVKVFLSFALVKSLILGINAQAQVVNVIPPANGLSADRPVFLYERNGVLEQPWGAAGSSWPQQLFWNNVPENNNHHLQEMISAARGIDASGRVPILGCVAWGYEYKAATGGDSANLAATPDFSKLGGWKQWGEWMKDTSRVKYYSTNWYGQAEPGYITPLMPMKPTDWPLEWIAPKNWKSPTGWIDNKPTSIISYGQWLGVRLSQLALHIGARGMYCADYVIGLEWGDAIDYNPRVVDDFAAWANVEIPQGTVAERADYVQKNLKSSWYDFKCIRFSEFYCSMGQNLLHNGKTPLLGGQTLGLTRGFGNDFRIYTQGINGSMHLPGKYWFFNLELQSDDLRPPHLYWESSIRMGVLACREPDMQLGAQLNAFGGQGMFDKSLKIANKDKDWGQKSLTNQWLSVGWTHIAGRNGQVRRAPMSFMRSYWDAGETPQTEFDLLLKHIPCHPFGPAVYYSVAIERQFEKGNGKNSNSWYMCIEKFLREITPIQHATRQGYLRGLFNGFWVSDVAIDSLKPVDYPAAWIVYDSEFLPQNERIKLEAIAPIVDPEKKFSEASGKLFPLCPVYIEQDTSQCLNGLAFVDQNNAVIIMVTNSKEKIANGKLVFQHVNNGTFNFNGLLACNDTVITVVNEAAEFPITVQPRATIVYESQGLKWIKPGNSDSISSIRNYSCNFTIYPNPSSGEFSLKLNNFKHKAEVCVYNAFGQIVYNKTFYGENNSAVDLRNCPRGVYFVAVNDGTLQSVQKLVIN